jgi:hypothetical protein
MNEDEYGTFPGFMGGITMSEETIKYEKTKELTYEELQALLELMVAKASPRLEEALEVCLKDENLSDAWDRLKAACQETLAYEKQIDMQAMIDSKILDPVLHEKMMRQIKCGEVMLCEMDAILSDLPVPATSAGDFSIVVSAYIARRLQGMENSDDIPEILLRIGESARYLLEKVGKEIEKAKKDAKENDNTPSDNS